MSSDDTTAYNPRVFVVGKDTNKRIVAGDEQDASPADSPGNYRALAGDESGARLLAGDEA